MATYTSDAAHSYVPPRSNEIGYTIAEGYFTWAGTTTSTGDVVQMLKIPNGAVIYDMRWAGRVSGTAGQVYNIGISGTASLFGPATVSGTDQYIALTASASGTAQFPYRVNLSDDAVNQFITILATLASGTNTATGTLRLVAMYAMPGQGRFS